MITIQCPMCGMYGNVPDEHAGRAVLCKNCQTKIKVPEQSLRDDVNNVVRANAETLSKRNKPSGHETVSMAATNFLLVCCCLLLAVMTCLAWSHSNDRLAARLETPSWEYKIIAASDRHIENVLSDLGHEGWELVSARRGISDEKTAGYEVMLKRKRDPIDKWMKTLQDSTKPK